MQYVSADDLKLSAEADNASDDSVWARLAIAASRVFDRAANAPDDFFAKAPVAASERTFRRNETKYLLLSPYVTGSIESVKSKFGNVETVFLPAAYEEKDGYLIFDDVYLTPFYFDYLNLTVKARWGFADVPADIQQAVIEQGIFMWRRKDLSFAEMAGISTAALAAKMSPTCQLVAEFYRDKYSSFFV